MTTNKIRSSDVSPAKAPKAAKTETGEAWNKKMETRMDATIDKAIADLRSGKIGTLSLEELKQFAYEMPWELDKKATSSLGDYVDPARRTTKSEMATPAQAIEVLEALQTGLKGDFRAEVGESKSVQVLAGFITDALDTAVAQTRTHSGFAPYVANPQKFTGLDKALTSSKELPRGGQHLSLQGKFGLVEFESSVRADDFARKTWTITPPGGQKRPMPNDELRSLQLALSQTVSTHPKNEAALVSLYAATRGVGID